MEPDEVPNELVSDAYLDKMERAVLNADSADPPTRPNAPDRRRVHDNFTLAAISEIRSLRKWIESVERALAAREAECAEVRAALRTAMEMVRLWHGMGMDTASEQRAWKLYEEGAPEWQPLRDVRDRPAGGNEALRAMLTKALRSGARVGALYALAMWGDRDLHRNDDELKATSAMNNLDTECDVEAIVARLLGETPTGEREGKDA